MRITADYPPIWLVGFAVLAWGQSRLLPMPGVAGVGWALTGAGVVLIGIAAAQFRIARTTIVPHEMPTALVTGGVYGLSRNPIYLADALILTGLCVIWGAWPSLVLVPLFCMVITLRFIRPEEARLRARFGPQFEDWAARVRRWV